MSVTFAEAEYIGHFRRLLAEGRPRPGGHGFVGLASEAFSVFERGLAGACVRFLLAEGGLAAAPTFDPAVDEHSVDRRFWEDRRTEVRLRFSPSLYELLLRLYNAEAIEPPVAGALDAADNLVLLMLLRRAVSRLGIAAWAEQLASLGPLPRLFYHWLAPLSGQVDGNDEAADDAEEATLCELEQPSTLDGILFALQPLLASCWIEGEQVLLGYAERGALGTALALAERRARLFEDVRRYVEGRKRLDLLRAFCVACGRLFEGGDHKQRVLDALEAGEGFADIVERHRAYARLTGGYRWLVELQALAETPALPMEGLDRAKAIGLFKRCYSDAVPNQASVGARGLLEALSLPEQPEETGP